MLLLPSGYSFYNVHNLAYFLYTKRSNFSCILVFKISTFWFIGLGLNAPQKVCGLYSK
jgi:hypothetical protein